MSDTTVHRIVAAVKMNFVFQCSRCRAASIGSTHRMALEADSPLDAMLQLELVRPHPSLMPIGWASSPEGFLCNKCLEIAREQGD